MCLRVLRVRYDVLLSCVSFVFLFVCVLWLICLCAVNMIYRLPVCGLFFCAASYWIVWVLTCLCVGVVISCVMLYGFCFTMYLCL